MLLVFLIPYLLMFMIVYSWSLLMQPPQRHQPAVLHGIDLVLVITNCSRLLTWTLKEATNVPVFSLLHCLVFAQLSSVHGWLLAGWPDYSWPIAWLYSDPPWPV